jgi:hypothetical protein
MDRRRGDTQLIIDACKAKGMLRNRRAYVHDGQLSEEVATLKQAA